MLIIEKGSNAKGLIGTIGALNDNKFTKQWMQETNEVFCIVKYVVAEDESTNHVVCVALLHKLDFDPMHLHDKMVLLDYIFTVPEKRRKGFAFSMLKKLKKKNKIIAFCSNDASVDLFKKSDFSYHLDNHSMMRFPPIPNLTDDFIQQLFQDEKKQRPLLVEGTLRHQDNLLKAKERFGLEFTVVVILTKYFSDNEDIPTIVCRDEHEFVLGKPRYPDCFTQNEYVARLIDRNDCGLYSLDLY